jgi:hypothetical protein
MLGNLPALTAKLHKSIDRSSQGKVRFGFTFGVVTGEDIAIEIERPVPIESKDHPDYVLDIEPSEPT